jgi:mannitol-1-phosphate 5-dehydrogenase
VVVKTGEAVVYGGGNVGRANLGRLLNEAGFLVTFVEVNEELIRDFNNERAYPVFSVSKEGTRQDYVEGVNAVSALDEAALIDCIVRADIITTAVGAAMLTRVAPTLAKGLMERLKRRPADEMHVVVVACENVVGNTEILRDHVLAALPSDEWRTRALNTFSFLNCAIDGVVPDTSSGVGHPLAVTREDYFRLAVDRTALRADMPAIPGIELVNNLKAVIAQKLFTFNGGHVAAGFWAYLKGCETISEAMNDPNIYALVSGLMGEVSPVLLRRYSSISAVEQQAFVETSLRRFMNPYLKDAPTRVGRDPMRKLGAGDRLVGPAVLAVDDGETPANLNMAIVGGLRFDSPDDPQAVELRKRIARVGVEAVVVDLTGLPVTHPVVRQAAAGHRFAGLMA